jgi:hypothetical protein
MADEHSQRTYRPLDSAGRATPKSASDPLAELARLIGQTDPFAEFGRANPRQAAASQPQARSQPHEPARIARPAAPVPGYTPQAQPAAEHPSMQGFRVQDYAGSDLYHTEPATPGYAAQAEPPAYEHEHEHHEEPSTVGYGAEDQDFYEDVQPRRRVGIIAIAAVFALAVVATAVAFGYRAIYGSLPVGPPPVIKADTKPIKVVPPSKDSTAKLIQERVPPQDDKLVTREEKPVDVQVKPAGELSQEQASAQAGAAQGSALGTGVIGGEPKKVHTITIRPDQAGSPAAAPAAPLASSTASNPTPPAAEDTVANAAPAAEAPPAAPAHAATAPAPVRHQAAARPAPRAAAAPVALANAPLSLSPSAPARAAPTHNATMRTASREAAPQPARTGGYAVQISSRRSEADAEAAFRSAQAKYPNLLSGQHSVVRRVDLGQKGVYYRSMIGPFASSEAASKLCNSLKAAGARCFVQRI